MAQINEPLVLRAATIDELLSADFEIAPGQKSNTDLAAERLAAWCRAAASGDWLLFARRLQRDGHALEEVLARLANVAHKASALAPVWADDAGWIEAALTDAGEMPPLPKPLHPFEHIFFPAVMEAERRLWQPLPPEAQNMFSGSARLALRDMLFKSLCDLAAPALYERFAKARRSNRSTSATEGERTGQSHYMDFINEMRESGLRRLFEEKPVLLRLIAVRTRQWLDASQEFVTRFAHDLSAIERCLLDSRAVDLVVDIRGGLSDLHHQGRSVLIVEFRDGARLVYKPKDLRIDVVWDRTVRHLNGDGAPEQLRTARVIAGDGYGWSEFVAHEGCADIQGGERFFRRAGAWLALFHCFAGTDMHQENMIADGDHPVPIDLEMLLQTAGSAGRAIGRDAEALEAARARIANSVMAVGLLPAYGSSGGGDVFAIGGMAADYTAETTLVWDDLNSDDMRPRLMQDPISSTPNIPHINGRYLRLGDHIEDFVAGFVGYAEFLARMPVSAKERLLADFAGLSVRKVIRPTQFYHMLLQRLRDHRKMADGVLWSAQADFVARFADWDTTVDQLWPLQAGERAALLALNVPRFTIASDGDEIDDLAGSAVSSAENSGFERAQERFRMLDAQEIDWQADIVRQNTSSLSTVSATVAKEAQPNTTSDDLSVEPTPQLFLLEADSIADEITSHAIRRGETAAWIGLNWLRNSDVSQLSVMAPDLYNGASGVAIFLAAHGAVRQCPLSQDLALAAIAHLRASLKSRNVARLARSLGIGGATGLGSIVYAFAVLAALLRNDSLLEDAERAGRLIDDDLITADKQLDVIGGSAGAILGLLRLYRDSRSRDILDRAVKCGEHLLRQPRAGTTGRRTWQGQGAHSEPLNGMSHGAAGFAFAMSSLAAATGREDFAEAANESIAFENDSYDPTVTNWPDFRGAEPHWRTQWCHGAVGIGLSRLAIAHRTNGSSRSLANDIRNAVAGVRRGWPMQIDTLCCGALGGVEFLCEAANYLDANDLAQLASKRLTAVIKRASSSGDYRWNNGERRFNLGLFRGLAGIGYTCLRRVDRELPNVLIWG